MRRQKRITVKEVAKRADVSTATVSHVITGAVRVSPRLRSRVLRAIQKLDYHPNHVARSLKVKSTGMLGMIISDITNPFFAELVRGAEDTALAHNYLLMTFNSDDRVERERRMLSVLRTRRVDGVLLIVSSDADNTAHIENTLRAGIPVVCLDRLPPGIRIDSVMVDNVGGVRECVQHLLSLGHQRIGIITGPQTLSNARERLQGYKEALKIAGIKIEPGLIREGDFRVESGHQGARELLDQPNPPTALFVSNNRMVLGALEAVEDLGLSCPRDVALAAFDDLPWALALRPQLTSIAQPMYAIGQEGVQLLLRRIRGEEIRKKNPVEVRLKTELRIRESTAGQKVRLVSSK